MHRMHTIFRHFSLFVLVAFLGACSSGGGGGGAPIVDTGTGDTVSRIFTSEDFAHEAVPTGHTVGVDNYVSQGSTVSGANVFHYAGSDCLRCHQAGGKAESVPFTMGGTVYKDGVGSEPLAGAEVILIDITGKVISMTTNAAGNFMTQTVIADADPDPEKVRRTYKAWVLGPEGRVLPMVTMAAHSCNMHHNPFNRRGSMWAGSWSASPAAAAVPATQHLSFKEHVLPIFQAKCAPCHIPSGIVKDRLGNVYPAGHAKEGKPLEFDYTAGFDLLRYTSIMDDSSGTPVSRLAPVSERMFINLRDDPATARDEREDSLIFQNMLGPETAHAGGTLAVDKNDPDYKTLLRWIREGAHNDDPGHTM